MKKGRLIQRGKSKNLIKTMKKVYSRPSQTAGAVLCCFRCLETKAYNTRHAEHQIDRQQARPEIFKRKSSEVAEGDVSQEHRRATGWQTRQFRSLRSWQQAPLDTIKQQCSLFRDKCSAEPAGTRGLHPLESSEQQELHPRPQRFSGPVFGDQLQSIVSDLLRRALRS